MDQAALVFHKRHHTDGARMSAVRVIDDLEAQIDFTYLRLTTAQTPELRADAWQHMQQLIKQRTPQHVAQMERNRGLAR